MEKILVVDDDLSMREFLDIMLTREGYTVAVAANGKDALSLAAENTFDLIITDIRMKPLDGIEVLKGVRAINPETVVILISAFATVETAVTAMKEGAYDFIPKPFNLEDLKSVVRSALDHRNPEEERKVLETKVKEGCHFGSLVGTSPEMLKVYDLIRRAAQTNTSILITGESGTGKELVARAIHDNSPRAREQFMAINCGGMPEQLIESELFGHAKGSFTGATTDKKGLFEIANRGTIFLDELGELSIPMQVKLLRVLQERTFRAVGGTQEHKVDVRFIAATNKNLEVEIMENRFREDLYYRINVINIHLPPLRERIGDVPLLAQFFLEKFGKSMGKNVRKMSAYALDILGNYHFPGNVRELENIVERSVALEQTNIVLPESLTLASFKRERRMGPRPTEQLPVRRPAVSVVHKKVGLDEILAEVEKYYLLKALVESGGVRKSAADLLGISAWRLRGRLNEYDWEDLQVEDYARIGSGHTPPDQAPPEMMPEWTPQGLNLDAVLGTIEQYLIDLALEQAEGSKTKAADILGVSRRVLLHRLSKFENR